MNSNTLERYAPSMLAVLRIMTALLFLAHGTQKLLGFPSSPNPGPGLFTIYGLAGALEIIGGVLLVLGLWTRPVAFLVSGEMAVAYFMGHFPRAFFPAQNGGDAAILFCFIFLYLVFAGPGAWSLDSTRSRKAESIGEPAYR